MTKKERKNLHLILIVMFKRKRPIAEIDGWAEAYKCSRKDMIALYKDVVPKLTAVLRLLMSDVVAKEDTDSILMSSVFQKCTLTLDEIEGRDV